MLVARRLIFSSSSVRCLATAAQEKFAKADEGPLATYESRVQKQQLTYDTYQKAIVTELQRCYDDVLPYTPPPPPGMLRKFLGFNSKAESPKGVYIWGKVGTGKTMLMDLLFDCAPIKKKKRVHFNKFMLDVHRRIHLEKKKTKKIHAPDQARWYEPDGTYTIRLRPDDPIPPVARSIADETWLICFDEFQVTDIGDAMILKRLFIELFSYGIVVIATSNRTPDDLYKNGLQRSHFLPFIPVLKSHCEVINLDSGIDYRTRNLPDSQKVYFLNSDPNAETEIKVLFKILTSEETDTIRPRTLTYSGRNVDFKRVCGGVLDSTFDELCNRPLGAEDYIQISHAFHTIFIRDIPVLNQKTKGQARRFITLIDTLYEHKVRIVCTSDVPHTQIFQGEEGHSEFVDKESLSLMDDLGLKERSAQTKTLSIFTGEEEMFAFDRTISRLTQMMTKSYWQEYESEMR